MISEMHGMGAAGRSLRLLLAASVALVLGGCAALEAKDRASSLELSTNAYATALRWGQYTEAARFRLPKSGPVEMPDVEPLEGIRLTSYEVTDQVVNEDVTEATLDVVIGYYHADVGRVETLKQSQLWWYEPNEKRWFLDTGLPPFLQHYTRWR